MNGDFNILLGCINLATFIFSVYFYTKSQEETFDNSDSWENKYQKPLRVAPVNWYYKFFKLKYKERFPLSGSFLVALTDSYHQYQLFFKLFLCTAIVLYQPLFYWWDALIYFVLWGIVFTLAFRK